MLRLCLCLALLTALATPASAECFADYKAKQDGPLRLHYGVAQVTDRACEGGNGKKEAKRDLAPRLDAAGWKLLNIVSTFGPEGLDERKASAGEFFLRF